jgi:hypothetical protein
MNCAGALDAETIERLRRQHELLANTYYSELLKDPTSLAAQSSRSNVMAVAHTITQLYGEGVAQDVTERPGMPTKTNWE